ncbi:MAG: YeeE/YedE family protein [Halobacteriaceae archaeon]
MSARDAPARGAAFHAVVYLGGLVFGLGLAVSGMVRPEVVLDFLQLEDFGLLFVMGGAAAVTGVTVAVATRSRGSAPLTGTRYARRLKRLDRNVVLGGAVFGVGWGVSGICPGAAYASLGVGNVPILWAVAGMFLGAYAQGYVRSRAGTAVEGAGPQAS